MAIPEAQLEKWSKQGSVTQSAATYETIKEAVESVDAPYSNRDVSSFLQGSYGNATNVYGLESDVDVVLQCSSVYYYDLSDLTEPERELYKRTHSGAKYRYSDFKNEVTDWLEKQFGNDTDPGQKAIRIKANDRRREADVLPCVQFRRYLKFNGDDDANFVSGVCFFLSDGTRVTNYPKLHKANASKKHQETESWFKPMVRVLKNMRNRMRDDGLIAAGIAPSYYLEGLLYNVPNELYGHSYERTFLNCYSFLQKSDRQKLVCANRQAWLLRANTETSWDPDDFLVFFDALAEFWNKWS